MLRPHIFFKLSNINDRRLDRNIDFYWLKLLLTSQLVHILTKKFVPVRSRLKFSSSDLPFNTLFIDYKV